MKPIALDLDALRQSQRILDVHAKVPDSIFYLRVSEKNLHSAEISGRPLDYRRFGAA